MDLERLQLLLHRYFDQLLDGEDFAELERMLLESSRAREEFWEMARWHALIRQWGQAEWGRRDAAMPELRVLPQRPRVAHTPFKQSLPLPGKTWSWQPLALAATVMFALLAAWLIVVSPNVEAPLAVEPPVAAGKNIAVLIHSSDAVWKNGTPARHIGESLDPELLSLQSGALEIEFSRGARVVLEGPAEFELVSASEGFLHSGKIHAMVPEPAHGFQIRAPGFSVVDLGTEFGCIVPLNAAAEVHVFTGLIELHSPGTLNGAPLRENQAVRFDGGKANPIAVNRAKFLGEKELVLREQHKSLDRLSLWHQTARELDENPATVMHLDFERESEWERTLANRAIQAPAGTDASIVGCDWADGRLPKKGALEFKRTDDRLRVSVPGSYRSLTLLAWIRVDSLANIQNSLLMTESFQPGELHWYLYRDGSLGLGVRSSAIGSSSAWRDFRSGPLVKPETFGSWVFVATVFDDATGAVTHYFNGKPVGSAQLAIHLPFRFDTFEIGNWGAHPDSLQPDEKRKYPRNFHGRIDEFAILSSPLDSAAILRLYEDSQPASRDSASGEDLKNR